MAARSEPGWHPAFRGVLFDHGGTLAHAPGPEVTLGKILGSLGYRFDPPWLSRAAKRFGEHWEANYAALPRGKRWSREIRAQCDRASLAELGLGGRLEEVAASVTNNWERFEKSQLYDDVPPTLDALQGMGLGMGIVSQRLETAGEFVPMLGTLGVEGYFRVVVTSEDAGFDKPDPRLFLWAAAKMGLKPSEICHVGDNHALDVVGAREARIRPILIDREGKDQHGDCTVVRTLTEIPNLVKTFR